MLTRYAGTQSAPYYCMCLYDGHCFVRGRRAGCLHGSGQQVLSNR